MPPPTAASRNPSRSAAAIGTVQNRSSTGPPAWAVPTADSVGESFISCTISRIALRCQNHSVLERFWGAIIVRKNPWLVLTVLAMAQVIVILDLTIVNVALPDIQHGLHFSTAGLQWVVNAYTLLFGGFLLLGGRAADLLGRRRLFIAGVVLFTAASLAAGLSQSSAMLIVARGVQGFGAAMM